MKKSMFMVALAAMSLASCSNDNVVDVPQPDEIKFNVGTANAGRAANVYSSGNKMTSFNVFAAYKGSDNVWKSYIGAPGDVISSNDNGNTWKNAETRYWAEAGTLDFYAIVNGTLNWSVDAANGATATVNDFTVPADVASQTDLLYAVKTAQKKENGTVNLNFRHALSQIVFNAVNKKAKLHVVVKGIEVIGKFVTKNTYTLPSADTDPQVKDTDTELPSKGEWAKDPQASATDVTYVPFTNTAGKEITYSNGETAVNLTNDNAGNGAMLLLPQTVKGWTREEDLGVNSIYEGAVVKVDCEIWNISGTSFDPTVDVPLHIGKAVLPLSANWEQGKKYIYTLVFGGTAPTGEDPGPGGYEEDSKDPKDPTPIMETISFSVTVDDFIPGDGEKVDVTPEQ